jgi:GH18 family chitinase
MDSILWVCGSNDDEQHRNERFVQDWEFPGARDRDASTDSKVKFNILVRELRQAFELEAMRLNRTTRLLLTAAVAADPKKVEQGYVVSEFCK